MFDLKKTIILALVIIAIVSTSIAGFRIGKMVGYAEGIRRTSDEQNTLVLKQDSLLRRQTETCHKLMDAFYENIRNGNTQK